MELSIYYIIFMGRLIWDFIYLSKCIKSKVSWIC